MGNELHELGQVINKKPTESPILTKMILKFAADEEDFNKVAESLDTFALFRRTLSVGAELGRLSLWQYANQLTFHLIGHEPMALPSAVAEVFASRLAPKSGVNVPEVFISDVEPDCFEDFVKRRGDVWITSKRLPRAIPVYFIKKANKTPLNNPLSTSIPNMFGELDTPIRIYFLSNLDKRCPLSRLEYTDFPHEAENDEKVIKAANWSTDERLLGHAFRAFLYASYGHSSNTLIDLEGNLSLIDFEKIIYCEDTSDIDVLYGAVKHSEKVLNACRQIAGLTEQDVEKSLGGIDEKFWKSERAAFNDKNGAAKYFKNRLRTWKAYFQPVSKAIAA